MNPERQHQMRMALPKRKVDNHNNKSRQDTLTKVKYKMKNKHKIHK